MQEMTVVMVKRAQKSDDNGLLEFDKGQRVKGRRARVRLLDHEHEHPPEILRLRTAEIAGVLKRKTTRRTLTVQRFELPVQRFRTDGKDELLELRGVVQGYRFG